MFILGIANQKGGVGKTTTVHNLGFGLAGRGYKTLMIDLDSQTSLSTACNCFLSDDDVSLVEVMHGLPLEQAIRPLAENLDLVPSHPTLAAIDQAFAGAVRREYKLWQALKPVTEEGGYDLVVLDCPPVKGLMAQNAYVCMTHLIVPIQCHFFSLQGMAMVDSTVQDWGQAELLRPDFQYLGYLPTFFDKRNNLCNEVLDRLKNDYGELVFKQPIRNNIKLAEAPSHFQDIFTYMPNSIGAEDYNAFVEEVLNRLNLKKRRK
jgi:ATPases involved in chromosome partitioning